MNVSILIKRIIVAIYPDRCIFCGNVMFTNSKLKICAWCEQYNMDIVESFALWYYEGVQKKAVLDFKFKNRCEYGITIAALMASDIIKKGVKTDINLIIPVPLHKSKKNKRGYNQAEVLANELGKHFNIPVLNNALVRIKKTIPQMDLNKEQRIINIKNSIRVALADDVRGKNILLIDDIFTTGSTLDECARQLKQSGANDVRYYCVCYQRFK